MRIGILGTGVIGTIYGWALSKNNEVIHIVRPEKLQHCNNQTISMDMIDERNEEDQQNILAQYTFHNVNQADEAMDLIIVAVCEEQLDEALKVLIPNAPNTYYLIMASNWKGTKVIDQYLNHKQYVLGYAGGGGTLRNTDDKIELWGNIGNDITLGALDKEQEPLLVQLTKLFQEINITPEIPHNILHWLWMHNVDSAAMGVGLGKYSDMSKFLQDQELVKICFAATVEGYAICESRGVDLNDFPEVQMYGMPFEQIYPMFRGNMESNPVMQRYTAHAVNAIDEMTYNFKEIYEDGIQNHIEMPNMQKLGEM